MHGCTYMKLRVGVCRPWPNCGPNMPIYLKQMVKKNNLWNSCPNTALVKLHRTLTKFRNLTFFEVRAKYTDLSQNNGTIANLWSFCAHSVLLKLHKMRTKFRNLILATHSKCGPIMEIYHIKTADCANLWNLFASKTSQTTCKIQ